MVVNRGGKNPLSLLSNSNIALLLMVFGLDPILTCALSVIDKQNANRINDNFFIVKTKNLK
jgi:hypothetical protein